MECLLKPKNINTLCRICLTPSKTLINLSSKIGEPVADIKPDEPIHSILEKVTFSKVILNNKKFPSKICQMCLSFLKISFEFLTEFKKSQHKLEEAIKEVPVYEQISEQIERNISEPNTEIQGIFTSSTVSAPVELIVGENRFDLNDVFIVEDEEKEKVSYTGFLNNLGTEITAKFIANNPRSSHREENTEHSEDVCTIERITKEEPMQAVGFDNFNNLDITELTVKNYPDENKIVIEKIDMENNGRSMIVRTLYQCKHCKKILCSKRSYEEHLQVKHSVSSQIYICDQCGHIAKTKSQFRHHMERHWVKDGYSCHLCGKRYTSSSHLRYHLSIHQNLRNFLCNVCGKNFNYATSLKYHLRLHAEKQFTCNICGTKFTMPQTLKRHLRIHTKERPYSCAYCHKRFSSMGEKRSHEMIHTGERPYKCKYCDKRFIKTVNMYSHCLQHPGPHQCHICLKGFIDIPTLKFHMRRAHREIISEINLVEVIEL